MVTWYHHIQGILHEDKGLVFKIYSFQWWPSSCILTHCFNIFMGSLYVRLSLDTLVLIKLLSNKSNSHCALTWNWWRVLYASVCVCVLWWKWRASSLILRQNKLCKRFIFFLFSSLFTEWAKDNDGNSNGESAWHQMSRENENVHKINPLMPKNNPLCCLTAGKQLWIAWFWKLKWIFVQSYGVILRWFFLVCREISTKYHEDRSNFVKSNWR